MKSICLTGLFVILFSTTAFSDDFSVEEFKKLHQQLQSSKNELWRSIPWKISLLEAQSLANQQKKPIFIWAMDGHPLGCT